MSYIWRTTHPAVRRQQYLDKKRSRREAYFKQHPEDAQKAALSFAVLILGVTLAIIMADHGIAAFVVLACSAALSMFLSPKGVPK